MLTQALVVVDTWQVRVDDLIARGLAEARRRNGWTQEQAARAFRKHGLARWRTSTVGTLEAGLRHPRLSELFLMMRAYEVTLDELLAGEDEHIEMSETAVMTPRGLRELLAGGFGKYDSVPADDAPYEHFPLDGELRDAYQRSLAERQRLEPLLEPLRVAARKRGVRLMRGDLTQAYRLPSDAERHAARRLKVDPAQVKLACHVLWDHRDFSEERDARIGGDEERAAMDPRTLQARRGIVARDMLGELRNFFDDAYGRAAGGGLGGSGDE